MAARQTVQEALDLIFQDEEADGDLEEDVSEQEDNMEEHSDYSGPLVQWFSNGESPPYRWFDPTWHTPPVITCHHCRLENFNNGVELKCCSNAAETRRDKHQRRRTRAESLP
ncbi:unnamed protein product [Pleuronectes platessa]|uniref:Uncharacterized protein n=1 Tax=Pleuronectes platessa TaxID=8262 RepID=A0A9N7USN1_PLEPL|nr:unnamed protein product [Pleuronectes platessa]